MLNGIAPLLIFNFPLKLKDSLFFAAEGIPTSDERTFLDKIGIPIPLYLDQKLTGLYVDSESKAIDIDTRVDGDIKGNSPAKVEQRLLNNTVTINMFASRNAILLGVLLAMNDLIFTKVSSKEYSVSYLNGQTTVFGGLLQSFTSNTNDNDDLIRITMVLTKANQIGTTPVEPPNVVSKVTGTVPL